MDLNYLYHRQQVSLLRAEHASCALSREAHSGLAKLYSGRIEQAKSGSPRPVSA